MTSFLACIQFLKTNINYSDLFALNSMLYVHRKLIRYDIINLQEFS